MYHKPRERRSWFAGWGYLGISLLLATPLTVGFSFLASSQLPMGHCKQPGGAWRSSTPS